jgi:glycosyltransferase involved in cell wall biosynthesis
MSDTSGKHFIIGVPTYNRAHLISRIISSVQDQLHSNWTILFVDDYSIDDTKFVILDFAENNKKIQYRQMNQNSGVNAVRNRIIEEAKAIDNKAYLLFIDDDDYLAPNSLVLADKEISAHPEYNWFSLNCNYEGGKAISKISQYGALSYLNDYMFGKKIRGDLTHILRVEAIGAERFTSEFKNGEEWSFWVKLSLKQAMYAIDAPGSIKEYLEGGLTETGINSDKAIQVLKFKIDTLEPIVGKKKMAHQHVSLAKHYLAKKDFPSAKVVLNKVFKSSPLYLRQYKHWVVLYSAK